MRHNLLSVGIALYSVIASVGSAYAISTYSATSTASMSLNLASPGSLSFVDVIGNYGPLATATSDGTTVVDSKGGLFGRSGAFTNLGGLMFPFIPNPTSVFDSVNAVIDGAEGRGRNEISSSFNTARFKAEAFGKATDPVEDAFSRVRWDVLVAFKNNSESSISFSWDLNYVLNNSAVADPRGTAFSTSRVRAQQGTFVNGKRITDPKISEDSAAACGGTDPLCTPRDNDGEIFTFGYVLAAGEVGFLNVEAVAEGSASVVPVPAALPLFGTGLAIMGFIGWRRKRKLATSA